MDGYLVVRIFIHGLLLLAPDYDGDAAGQTEVDTLKVFLVDARQGEGDLDEHLPLLITCAKVENGQCVQTANLELANDGEPRDFEDLEVAWKQVEAEAIAPGTVKLDDSAGTVDAAFPAKPPSNPGLPAEGADFDWIASLATALGEDGPLDVKQACEGAHPPDAGCDIVARVEFSDGVASTCEFVAAPIDNGAVVPSVTVVAPAPGLHRAMASIVMIELRQKLSQQPALDIKSSFRTISIDQKSQGVYPCPEIENSLCADVAITNIPEESEWSGVGKHFRALYQLVDLPPNTPMRPYPMIVWGAPRVPRGDVHRECPMPKEFRRIARFELVSTRSSKEHRESILYIENRPICPPGTP